MVRENTTYFCEKCNREYRFKKDAESCETEHLEVIGIDFVKYTDGKKLPTSICVKVQVGDDIKQAFYKVLDEYE